MKPTKKSRLVTFDSNVWPSVVASQKSTFQIVNKAICGGTGIFNQTGGIHQIASSLCITQGALNAVDVWRDDLGADHEDLRGLVQE